MRSDPNRFCLSSVLTVWTMSSQFRTLAMNSFVMARYANSLRQKLTASTLVRSRSCFYFTRGGGTCFTSPSSSDPLPLFFSSLWVYTILVRKICRRFSATLFVVTACRASRASRYADTRSVLQLYCAGTFVKRAWGALRCSLTFPYEVKYCQCTILNCVRGP